MLLRKLLKHHPIEPAFGEPAHDVEAQALFVDDVGGFGVGGFYDLLD